MGNTNKKTKQHITPKFYLDFFSHDEGEKKLHIWVYDKKTRTYFTALTNNVGYVKDFYTLNNVENIYAWDDFYTYFVEPEMSVLFRNAIKSAGSMVISQNADIITPNQKAKMSMFIATQILRGKRFVSFADMAYDIPSEIIKKYTGIVIDDKTDNKKIDIASFSTDRSYLSLFTMYIHNRSWVFYYSKEDIFITSDEPVVLFDTTSKSKKQGLFECGLASINTAVCMPFNSNILLVMYHPLFRGGQANVYDKKRVILDIQPLVQKHNKGQHKQSTRFLYGKSESLLRATVEDR